MKTIAATALDESLGKPGFWNTQKLTGAMNYQYGLAAFDEIKADNPSSIEPLLNFVMRPNGVEISMMHRFKLHRVGVAFDDLRAVELSTPQQIISAKEKSVIGRAVLGGLLLGGIGALIGGLSGLQGGVTIDQANAFLTLQLSQSGEEHYLIALVKSKNYKEVQQFLSKNLPGYLR